MNPKSLLIAAVAAMTLADLHGASPRSAQEKRPKPFTHADAERIAKAEAKRARKAARRAAQAKEGGA